MLDDGTRRWTAAAAVCALLVLLLALGAAALLVVGSLESRGAWRDALGESGTLEVIGFSVLQAAIATAVGLALGLPASWVLSRRNLPFRGLLLFLLAAPLAIPGVVVALGIEVAIGGDILPRVLVTAAHALFATAAVVWLVTPAWAAGDPRAGEDARTLGARRLRAYFTGAGREVPAAVRVAAALAFWFALAGAGTAAVLGGDDGATVESVLAFGDPAVAAPPASEALAEGALTAERSVLALVQVAVAAAVLFLGGARWPAAAGRSSRAGAAVLGPGALYLVALAAILWTPLAVVASEAANAEAFEGLLDARVGERTVTSLLLWTAAIGATAALAATLLGWGASALLRRDPSRPGRGLRVAAWAAVLPAALTGAALGWAGLVLADRAAIDLDRTYALTIAAHALLAYPFAVRILAARPRVPAALVEDALVLGASRRTTRWRLHGRRTAMALGAAFLVSAVLSAGEVAAANLLTPREATPSAIGILRGWLVGEGGEVYALGAALGAAAVLAFGIAEWLRRAAARVEAG